VGLSSADRRNDLEAISPYRGREFAGSPSPSGRRARFVLSILVPASACATGHFNHVTIGSPATRLQDRQGKLPGDIMSRRSIELKAPGASGHISKRTGSRASQEEGHEC
jgi:hypothetical protein